jgi:hypothetical protein
MSHHGKSLGGVNIHVLDGAAKPGPFQKPPTDRVRLAMVETFRAALAAGLSRSEAADLVMSTMLAGVVGAALSETDRARLTMSVQAETRNLVVGIQAGRARRAA